MRWENKLSRKIGGPSHVTEIDNIVWEKKVYFCGEEVYPYSLVRIWQHYFYDLKFTLIDLCHDIIVTEANQV